MGGGWPGAELEIAGVLELTGASGRFERGVARLFGCLGFGENWQVADGGGVEVCRWGRYGRKAAGIDTHPPKIPVNP